MTLEQLRTLRRSFARIEPQAHQLSTRFYERLFAEAPHLKELFRKDLKAQHAKFMKVVAEMIRLPLLSFPATAGQDAQAYVPGAYWGGMLHGALGVRPQDFAPMREALLWALLNTPGIEITMEEQGAWAAGYDVLAKAMAGGVEEWHVQEAGEHMKAEPGTSFLQDISERSEAQECAEQEPEQTRPEPDQGLVFLKDVAKRGSAQ